MQPDPLAVRGQPAGLLHRQPGLARAGAAADLDPRDCPRMQVEDPRLVAGQQVALGLPLGQRRRPGPAAGCRPAGEAVDEVARRPRPSGGWVLVLQLPERGSDATRPPSSSRCGRATIQRGAVGGRRSRRAAWSSAARRGAPNADHRRVQRGSRSQVVAQQRTCTSGLLDRVGSPCPAPAAGLPPLGAVAARRCRP